MAEVRWNSDCWKSAWAVVKDLQLSWLTRAVEPKWERSDHNCWRSGGRIWSKAGGAAPDVSLQKWLLKRTLGEIHNLQRNFCSERGKKKSQKGTNQSSKVTPPFFQTAWHCNQAENAATDGSGVTNALIVHYIWRIQRFETQKGWGVGIQSIR